ncbi:MAG: ATP-binding protein [Myxococcaceae bacterium]
MAEPVRILVVDDDDAKRYVVIRMLRAAGYQIDEAATGQATLDRVKRERPDLIVLDVKLPDIDGMEVARRLKEDPTTRSTLVLQLSARFRDPASRSMGLDAGADAYLAHPVDSEELLATVRALLRISRSERALREANERAQEALRQANDADERLHLTLEVTRLGTWEWRPGQTSVHLDANLREICGFAPDEVISREEGMRRIHPADAARVEQSVQAALRGDNDGRFDEEFRVMSAGDVRWIETRGRCFRGPDGSPDRFIGTAQRIDDRKRREEQAERWAEYQQYMLGVVGHDLRNPLTAIITTASTQLRKTEDETLRRAFSRVLQSGTRANRIVSGLLDYTRARLGTGIPVERREVDLSRLLRNIVDEAIAAAPERPIAMDVPSELIGQWDGDRLDQVFMNLLTNALQYGPPHEPISLSAELVANQARVRVHNGGSPIPEELQARIFEPYRRGTDDGRGLGLGLYIVKQLVTAHGGEVSVASQRGRGTTFSVTLPLQPQ